MLLSFIFITVAVLAAAALIGFGITIARRSGADRLDDRLGRYVGGDMAVAPDDDEHRRRPPARLAQVVEKAVSEKSFTGNIRTELARADLRLTVGEWLIARLGIVVLSAVLGLVVGWLRVPSLAFLVGLAGGAIGYFAPGWYLKWRIRGRIKKFVNQLGDTITLMANALRAGYSLLQAMDMVSRETPPPIADEFRRVVREIGLGIGHQEAMAHLMRRIPSDDLDLMISAINIQHEVGGNLAQILDVIGLTIRERIRIKGEIGVLTAQQSISGYVISALPVVLGGVLFLVSPSYISQMFVFPWVCMPIGSGIMITIGFFVMKKITNIEV